MIIEHIAAGPLMVNCFILGDPESGEALVIDPGGHVHQIVSTLNRHHLALKAIVNTHGHWDHTGGNAELKQRAGGRILIHAAEDIKGFSPDDHIQEGDRLTFGPHALHVLDTPGHSAGGISLHWPERQTVFVGDLLFEGSIGRTDLNGGSFPQLIRSVQTRIYPLGDDTQVIPGHGPSTTVGRERETNPFLTGALS